MTEPSGVRPERDVTVNSEGFDDVPRALLSRAALRVLEHEGAPDAEVSVTLLDDEAIRGLNRRYLSEDRPTDVIAFSIGDEGRIIGDVYLGHDQAARQAAELNVSLVEELARLTIHGVLHVLGHDHPVGEERAESPMYTAQERILEEVLGRP